MVDAEEPLFRPAAAAGSMPTLTLNALMVLIVTPSTCREVTGQGDIISPSYRGCTIEAAASNSDEAIVDLCHRPDLRSLG